MQVPPNLPPVVPGAQPQDVVTKNLPQIQGQAMAPVTQRAVDPSPKSERGNKARKDKDRGGSDGGKSGGRGGSLNIRV